jgi:MraZ protein
LWPGNKERREPGFKRRREGARVAGSKAAGEAGRVEREDAVGADDSPALFRGVTELALDSKGRLAIPSKHRDALIRNGSGRVVVTADPSRCLLLYPLDAWEPIQSRLMALSSFNEKIRGLQRLIVGHADDVEVDAAGRILVPPALRRYASLDKHVVLVGQGQKFELWDQAQWQTQTAQTIAFPADGLPPELDGFSL